ncbi:MAG TPA: hypothetical protein VJ991_12095 [Balneolales bacterium]|nr:hypothetical protein [Balneolales bacterium]
MKLKKMILPVILLLGFVMYLPDNAFSQRGRGAGGWGMQSQYNRLFNPNTITSFSGTVTAVNKFTPRKGMSYGIHLMVKSDNGEEIPVHLGPAWFLNNQEMSLKTGDKIMLKGSKVTYNEKPAIIASEVTKDKYVLQLRDKNGFPAWAGWRMRQQQKQNN